MSKYLYPEQLEVVNKSLLPLKHNDILWKHPACPRHVIQMLIVDPKEHFLLMHRSPNVRSARNVWSIPTGEHELGETANYCLERELEEEFALRPIKAQLLDQYENIAGDPDATEQYHWVLTIFLVLVHDVTFAVNREPDKHDQMIFPDISLLADELFLDNYQFHQSLQDRLFQLRHDYYRAAKYFINPAPTNDGQLSFDILDENIDTVANDQ